VSSLGAFDCLLAHGSKCVHFNKPCDAEIGAAQPLHNNDAATFRVDAPPPHGASHNHTITITRSPLSSFTPRGDGRSTKVHATCAEPIAP
jgi:hypothetical protein